MVFVSSCQSAWSEITSGSSTPCWRARARTRIQPEANAVTGSGSRRDQRSAIALGGASTISPFISSRVAPVASLERAELDAERLVERAAAGKSAMQIDRRLVARLAQKRDQPLALAEPIDADDMSPLGELAALDLSSFATSALASPCWNTGSAKVASVMKRSHGTSSKAGQVGSALRL